MTEAEQRAARWISAWDGHGLHHTGASADHAGAEWLAAQAEAFGAWVTTEQFELDRLDPLACHLEIDDESIPAIPVFDAPSTGADGIAGRLGDEIAVAELPPQAVYSGAFERLREQGGHRALVVICAGADPGPALLNAERFRAPYGAPAIHVSSEARDGVLAALREHKAARLVADSRRIPARAVNVVATMRSDRRGQPPLVVMTPRSSWWQSTAERGGGLVCWLESLRALLAAPNQRSLGRDVIFTANSGHELGHLGLDDFIERRPGWEKAGGATWLHYGANLGAYGSWLSLVSNDGELRKLDVIVPAILIRLLPGADAGMASVSNGEIEIALQKGQELRRGRAACGEKAQARQRPQRRTIILWPRPAKYIDGSIGIETRLAE